MRKNNLLQKIQKYYPHVQSVDDAPKRSSFVATVTTNMAKRGIAKNPAHCPLARGIQELFDGAIVNKASTYVIVDDKALRYRTPRDGWQELVSKDVGLGFTPGQFRFTAFAGTMRLDAKRLEMKGHPGGRTGPSRGIRKHRVIHRTEGTRVF